MNKENIKYLFVIAPVYHPENSYVNSISDINFDLIPCVDCGKWSIIIDIDCGKIINWEVGKTAEIYYEVKDEAVFIVKNEKYQTLLSMENCYVPLFLRPENKYDHNYISMNINIYGYIEDWERNKEDREMFLDYVVSNIG